MTAKKFRRRKLVCGCCGTGFHTWEGYRNQDQDRGYGICRPCQGMEEARNARQWSDLCAQVRAALSDDKRRRWDSWPEKKQMAFCLRAIEKGWISFAVRSPNFRENPAGRPAKGEILTK